MGNFLTHADSNAMHASARSKLSGVFSILSQLAFNSNCRRSFCLLEKKHSNPHSQSPPQESGWRPFLKSPQSFRSGASCSKTNDPYLRIISKNPIFLKLFCRGWQVVQLQIEGEMASVAAHLVFASVAELLVKLVKPVDSRSPCNSCGQICPQISTNIT